MAQPTVNLEVNKQIIDNLFKLTPRNKPNEEKIKAIPKLELLAKLQHVIQIVQDEKTLKPIADDKKKKRIIASVKAILEVMDKEDPDYQRCNENINKVNVEKPSKTTNKRKKTKGFTEESSFNPAAKVPKVIEYSSDKPIPPKWIQWNTSLREPVVFIEIPEGKESQELKKEIESNKMNSKINAEITSIRAKKEKIIVSLSEANQIPMFVKQLQKLFKDINVYTPELKDPMIQIYGIPAEYEINEFILNLRKFNSFNKEDKIMFHKSFMNSKTNTKNVILRVSPAIRDEIEGKRGKLFFGCSTYKVVDYFAIVRCFRCLRFAHLGTECASQSVCKYCAKFHRAETCPDKFNSSNYKCATCNIPGHKADDKKNCPEYVKQLNYAISITNYSYNYLMTD